MQRDVRVGWLILMCLAVGSVVACGDDDAPRAGPCVMERDDGVDDSVDRRLTYTYEKGRLVLLELDEDADGTVDSVFVYEYEDGVLRRELDGDAPDGANGIEYLYDGDGFPVQLGYDDDGDAVADRGHVYVNDADGNLLTHEHYDDFTAEPSWRDTYTYDADGYLETVDHDIGADDTVEDRITYVWSTDRLDLQVETDRGQDEVLDRIDHYVYDDQGNTLLEEQDWDGDGVWDRRDEYEYADGRLIRAETDEFADGSLDALVIYQYDGRGNRTLAAFYDGAQTPLMRIYATYNSRGDLLTEEQQDGDGEVQALTTYDYSCWK